MGRQLYLYTVGLIKVKDGEKEVFLCGSGILIDIGGTKGILTAKHVAENIRQEKNGKLGIVLVEKSSHRFTIEVSYLTFYDYGINLVDDIFAPDISFIRLPLNSISSIKSYKSFYNLSTYREYLLDCKDDFSEGIWFLCGFPEWGSKIENKEAGFDKVISLYGICGATGVSNNFYKDGFNYYEATIDYNGANKDIPLNFGGMSGGGLWKVSFGNNFNPQRYYLCGLIISQSVVNSEMKRTMTCLGRDCIYHQFFDFATSCLGEK